ncbi:HlyD family efflux transporter periplasmic adaptor subunit [Roseomonas sp. JC162]|uniref:HlyD family efflux transporter periplasmic adaptor subunit n=1 Tax=Neoroseomonas marina TaxID=1232220 RepID=A0A848ED03_9PROT|nr:HlyD family efflux transporter periplasmic adaptor subunit [Neoroseomonas marina]NMJ42444.1 HlyD family efflux transporter periplasmic adaptor subunit [Neoroseomonas marina]
MNRWVKVGAGILLLAAGLYVIVGEQMAGVSADAVVNAQVVTVRAPVDGIISLQVRTLGTRVTAEEPLGNITDPRPDELRLTDLRQTLAHAETDLRRIEDLINALVASRAAYAQQAEDYGVGRTRQVEARLAEATAALEAAQARLREADATMRRATDLSRQGIQTAADFNRARAGFEVGGQEVEVARNRLLYLTIEADAARRGVFLGDSYNDAPSSQQRVRELDQRIGELSAEVRERNRRIAQLEAAVAEERVRLARFREARLIAPAPGVLWEIMTGNGEYVRRAQDVLRLVDCTTTLVTASVRESVYNRLKVGDAVQFRLLDDGRIFEGVVARLAGSGAETIYRSLAVGPSAEHLKRFDVAVSVPALAADPELACAVGRTGRTVFAGRPLDALRRLMSQFGLF